MKISFLITVYFTCIFYANSQKKIVINTNEYIGEKGDYVGFENKTTLIFEKQFNDTLTIEVNKKTICQNCFFKTNNRISKSENDITFKSRKNCRLTITIKSSLETLVVNVKKGFRYIYFEKYDTGWAIHHSNYFKDYF